MNWAAIACTLCLATACSPRLAPPPDIANASAFHPTEVVEATGVDDAEARAFTLTAGDVVRVAAVGQDPWVLETVIIDATGAIHLPLIGAVHVEGCELAEAEKRATGAIRRYDRFSQLSVSLVEARGHRATIVGAVVRPGAYGLPPGSRLSELIALAGGPVLAVLDDGETIPAADVEGAQLIRQGSPLPISVPRALRGEPRHDVRLRAGDVLWMPSAHAKRISVLGEVNRGRTVPYRPGMRLTEALALAGGPTPDADLGDLRVLRGTLAHPSVYRARLSDIIAGEAPDVRLEPGDVVFVTQHWSVPTKEIIGQVGTALAGVAVGAALFR